MKSSKPPALATWLLEHAIPGKRNEALAGDLFEQFGQGRTSLWYWRQVLGAILLGYAKQWPVFAWASAIILLWAIAGVLSNKLEKWGPFPQMLRDVRLVEQLNHVQRAEIQQLTQTSQGRSDPRKIYVVNVFWTGKPSDEEAFANSVAKLIIQNDSTVRDYDALRVAMIRGYDLGIAHAQVSHPFQHPPAQW